MDNKPETLRQIWREEQVASKLGLPLTKGKRSLTLSYWIKGGLPCIKISGKRYFTEQDLIHFLMIYR